MGYTVRLTKRVTRELTALPRRQQVRVARCIDQLAENPRPEQAISMKGTWADHLRVRVGDYRIIYTIRDDEVLVLVVRIGHRREVYR